MGWLSSINKERKRTPVHKWVSDNLFSGAHAYEKPEGDLEQRQKDMEDYVMYGPQEGRPTFSQSELREGAAGYMSSGNKGDVYGTTGEFVAQDKGDQLFDERFYQPINVSDDSWLSNQLKGTTGESPAVAGGANLGVSGPTPAFGQYTPPPAMLQGPQSSPQMPASRPDYSGGNPFAQHARNIGFSDYQNAGQPTSSPATPLPIVGPQMGPNRGQYAGIPQGAKRQAAIASALRGGAE